MAYGQPWSIAHPDKEAAPSVLLGAASVVGLLADALVVVGDGAVALVLCGFERFADV